MSKIFKRILCMTVVLLMVFINIFSTAAEEIDEYADDDYIDIDIEDPNWEPEEMFDNVEEDWEQYVIEYNYTGEDCLDMDVYQTYESEEDIGESHDMDTYRIQDDGTIYLYETCPADLDVLEYTLPTDFFGHLITKVYGEAMRMFSYIEKINIPSTITYVDPTLFCFHNTLKEINVDPDNKYYSSENGVLFNKDKTKIIAYPSNKNQKSYSIPDSVKVINYFAFMNCNHLENIYIPKTVSSIESEAFYGCKNLKEVAIPKTVENIEDRAFGYYADEDLNSKKIEGFEIIAERNSKAEKYAGENKFPIIRQSLNDYIRGDANMDMVVNISDATIIQQCLSRIIDENKINIKAATMTGTRLSISDATHIQQYLSRMITEL